MLVRRDAPAAEDIRAKPVLRHEAGAGGAGQGRKRKGVQHGPAFGADEKAALVEHQFIRQPGADQGGGERAAGFGQDAGQAACGQCAQRGIKVEDLWRGGGLDQFGAGGGPGGACGVGRVGVARCAAAGVSGM